MGWEEECVEVILKRIFIFLSFFDCSFTLNCAGPELDVSNVTHSIDELNFLFSTVKRRSSTFLSNQGFINDLLHSVFHFPLTCNVHFFMWAETTIKATTAADCHAKTAGRVFSHFLYFFSRESVFIGKTTSPDACTQEVLVSSRGVVFSRGSLFFSMFLVAGCTFMDSF